MEIKIDKIILNNAIKKVSRAISSKVSIPVLSGIHLVASQNGLMVTGSDSDLSIRTIIPNDKNDGLEIIQEGSIVLPAKELSGIARTMPDQFISIRKTNGLQVIISSGKSKFTLNGLDGESYPKLPEINSEGFSIEGSVLKSLVEKTVYAVSTSETRPILTGVNLFYESGKIGMVATDSHRLSKVVGGNVQEVTESETVTIPNKTLKELPALIDESKEVIVIQKESQIVFKTDDVYVLSRLLTGSYPQTDRLIPKDYKTLLTVDRKNFLSSIERSTILQEKDRGVVTLKVTDKNSGIFETIELSHKNGELGQSREDIVVEGIEGEEITVSFNPRYMIDALKRIDEDKVAIEFNGAMKPFLVKPLNQVDFIQLILPVREY